MKRVALWPALAPALAAIFGCNLTASGGASNGQDFVQRERGRYLVTAADCAACHDDPADHAPFAGGRAIETPFGTVVAANITPDRDTGIGSWSDAQFDDAVRHGRRPDGSRLYPAMPYPYYTKLSASDVRAMRAYLRTVPAISHPVVSNRLPFPFNVRAGMLVWDELYFNPGQYRWNDAKSAEWNRGAFLVQGPGHCGACHTPKTFLGGDKTAEELRGYKTQGWFAPAILRAGGGGLDGWSAADTVSYLKSGHNRFAAASGPMAEEVAMSSSKLTDGDLQDIAVYLEDPDVKGVGARRNDQAHALRADDPMMKAGAAIYSDLCASCHRSDGAGVAFLIPNLSASVSVASYDPTTLIRVVLLGADSVATQQEPTAPAMPSFAWQLSDVEIAAVTTYVRNAWNHAAPPVAESDVREARDELLAARPRP